jgi:hypothetical protein
VTSRPALLLALLALGCGNPASPSPRTVTIPHLVEGLVFGSGPVGFGEWRGIRPGTWTTWPRGSQVEVVVGLAVPEPGRRALERSVSDLNAAMAGRMRLALVASDALDPLPRPGQITTADVPRVDFERVCTHGDGGCTTPTFGPDGLLQRVRILQLAGVSDRLRAHEMGHAVGLCHLHPDRVPDAVMTDRPGRQQQPDFTDRELEAIRRVFSSGLEPGATIAAFRQAGLVD